MTFEYRVGLGFLATVVAPLLCSAPVPQGQAEPLYRITIERTIPAVNYRPNGSTRIDFRGTALAFQAAGDARVRVQRGATRIEAHFDKLPPASDFGPEFLTYVLWAISPEGRARNLGEVVLDGRESRLKVTTSLQSFGMMLTAEPYFAVSIPSDLVVMENVLREDTLGSTTPIDAKFELLQRGDYAKAGLKHINISPKVPLDLYQARNAVQIAKSAGAERYSADSLVKSTNALQNAESYQARKGNRKMVISFAREAVQAAEDARMIAGRRATEELARTQKAEAAAREAEAKTQAESAAKQKREAEQAAALAQAQFEREARQKLEAEQAAADARAEAERQLQQKREADLAAARAEAAQARAELEEDRAKREAEQQRQAREVADAARLRVEAERQELRASLLKQFNAILETRDTPRGLVVNLGDVLFDTGRFELRPVAREVLAKLSGIVLSHPGLKLEIEGHTDSLGSIEFNQELSEKRAESVRGYLLEQSVPGEAVTARGFGKATPVASNNTPEGRQLNRRVEIIVSGEVIGVNIHAREGLKVR